MGCRRLGHDPQSVVSQSCELLGGRRSSGFGRPATHTHREASGDRLANDDARRFRFLSERRQPLLSVVAVQKGSDLNSKDDSLHTTAQLPLDQHVMGSNLLIASDQVERLSGAQANHLTRRRQADSDARSRR